MDRYLLWKPLKTYARDEKAVKNLHYFVRFGAVENGKGLTGRIDNFLIFK